MGGLFGDFDPIAAVTNTMIPGIQGSINAISGGMPKMPTNAFLPNFMGPVGQVFDLIGGIKGGGGGGSQPGMNPWTIMPVPKGQEAYYDEFGRPKLPEFNSINDPTTGLPKSQYQTQDVYDMRGMEGVRGEALRQPGTMSKWRELAQADESNRLAQAQSGQLSQARNQLAMSGGLRSGAGERLANQSMQSGLTARQNLGSQMSMQDETNRQKWLQMLPGMEQSLANYKTGVQDTNIGRGLADIGGQRAWDMGRYNEGMKAWAAQQTANAMPQTQDRGFLGNLFSNIF